MSASNSRLQGDAPQAARACPGTLGVTLLSPAYQTAKAPHISTA